MVFTLKQARVYRNKTQQDMADLIGVHVDTYRKYEQNPDVTPVGMAKKISDYLDMEYDIVFFGTNFSLNRERTPNDVA